MVDTVQFEAVKTGLKQSKDGYMLSLVVHPDDLPNDLMRDFVGSRYMVVMVRLNDEDKPMDRVKTHHPAVSLAGMLCRDPDFWSYIHIFCDEEVNSEGECVEWMKMYFDIGSRTELKTNDLAKEQFMKFREGFEAWRKS